MCVSTQCNPGIDEHAYPSKTTDSVSQIKTPESENGSSHFETIWLRGFTANRGACHLNGHSAEDQNVTAFVDSTGLCLFAHRGYREGALSDILEAVSGRDWVSEDYVAAGERIFNLEKCFNYREGFRREDDVIADRFFEEPLTAGMRKGAVLDRGEFESMMTEYYEGRGWDPKTTRPSDERLRALRLDFVIDELDH